jgi:hypothetical protein
MSAADYLDALTENNSKREYYIYRVFEVRKSILKIEIFNFKD